MTARVAACRCGQLTATVTGEPVRVSVCHCHDCQKRTGGPFAAQARFPAAAVVIGGESRVWERTGDSGRRARFHWCPDCGGSLFYTNEGLGDQIAITLGAFAPDEQPRPTASVFENRKRPWLDLAPDLTRE